MNRKEKSSFVEGNDPRTYAERTNTEVRERSHFTDNLLLPCDQFCLSVKNQDEIIRLFSILVDIRCFAVLGSVFIEFKILIELGVQ